MKWVYALMLSAILLAPMVSSAGKPGKNGDDDDRDTVSAVPEPSGALVMSIALTTVALAARRMRK